MMMHTLHINLSGKACFRRPRDMQADELLAKIDHLEVCGLRGLHTVS